MDDLKKKKKIEGTVDENTSVPRKKRSQYRSLDTKEIQKSKSKLQNIESVQQLSEDG